MGRSLLWALLIIFLLFESTINLGDKTFWVLIFSIQNYYLFKKHFIQECFYYILY